MSIYYAHSTDTPDKADWQPLEEHLENVAGEFAKLTLELNQGEG